MSRDWKLNPSFFKVCKDDAINICSEKKNNCHETEYSADEGPLVLPYSINILTIKITKIDPNI